MPATASLSASSLAWPLTPVMVSLATATWPMPVLSSRVDTASEVYQKNRAAHLAAIAALNEQLELARAGGGPRYAKRHRDRGRLLARERMVGKIDDHTQKDGRQDDGVDESHASGPPRRLLRARLLLSQARDAGPVNEG